MKIVGIGETVLDIIFREDMPQAAVPGGSTFNALISLGRTVGRDFPEVPVMMVTEVGDDHVGDIVVSFMERNQVGTSAVTRNRGTQSHISLAFLDAHNDAHYEFYKDHASASLSDDRLGGVAFAEGDLVLFGSFFAINPRIRPQVGGMLRAAHDAGAFLYYDINFRPSHLVDLPETMGNIEENCRLSDVVRGSSEDFGYLFGTTDPSVIYHEHISRLCPYFICTCGADPVEVFTPSLHLSLPVEPIETVSTVGAGDNFNAGFLYGLLRNRLTGGFTSEQDESEWRKIVATATHFSACACRSVLNYVDEDFRP